jgi:hypothetical protein
LMGDGSETAGGGFKGGELIGGGRENAGGGFRGGGLPGGGGFMAARKQDTLVNAPTVYYHQKV